MMLNRTVLASLLLMFMASVAQSQSPCFDAVKTDVMKVNSPAQTMDVQLNQASDLYLVVTYGPDNYDCDQAAWCNPTLYDKDGNAVDMTTLTPVSAKTGWGEMQVNKDHANRTVKICGKTFEKALFAHAPSILHFKLDGKYTRFTAQVGLVESAERGSVTFEVYCHPVEYPSEFRYKKGMPGAPLPPPPLANEAPVDFNSTAAKRLLDKGIEEIVFIRRITLTSNHVYTDHVNSRWAPGGGLTILNLKTGKIRDVNPILADGVINRFDVSFDSKKIVFDWKRSNQEGYRIYEINVDGTGLKQLTFPPEIEDALHKRFMTSGYHRGTDDMQPCYLPDGGIAFISTRCLFSVLCDAGDHLTVSNLYRMNGDGSNMQPLTFSALSEQSPAMLPDGRILYHRWEYVDKAAGNVKALWAVNPDGTNSSEVYGNTITFPESMMYPRPIPGTNKIVFLGASHCCPNNAMGTVVVIDTKDNVRSVDTMKLVTSDVSTFHHNGFHFKDANGNWFHDMTGKPGRLFKDPYPISEELYLVSCKPKGLMWNDPTGYALSVLDGKGADETLLKDNSISCWLPYPLVARPVPPVRPSLLDENLAKQNKAVVVMTDVYTGLDDVPRGTIKYLRILEQIPRSWSARKPYWDDHADTTHAHSAIGAGHLAVRIQLGIVPVEEDGSARFYVPADRAIIFQALDKDYRAVQTERTYVNFRPGETRACVGCHETPNNTPTRSAMQIPIAMKKPIATMTAQPNQTSGYLKGEYLQGSEMTFDYTRQIQPILDKNCVKCHDGSTGEGKSALNLTGKPERTYSVSYNAMLRLANDGNKLLWGNRNERNEDAASNGITYIRPYQICSPSSSLSAWLMDTDCTFDSDAVKQYAKQLKAWHPDVKLTADELLTINNWLDDNCPFHPSFFGRLHSKFEGQPMFRPVVTPEEARDRDLPKKFEF